MELDYGGEGKRNLTAEVQRKKRRVQGFESLRIINGNIMEMRKFYQKRAKNDKIFPYFIIIFIYEDLWENFPTAYNNNKQ